MRVVCPYCSQEHTCDNHLAGQVITCEKCGLLVFLPALAELAEANGSNQSSTQKTSCSRDFSPTAIANEYGGDNAMTDANTRIKVKKAQMKADEKDFNAIQKQKEKWKESIGLRSSYLREIGPTILVLLLFGGCAYGLFSLGSCVITGCRNLSQSVDGSGEMTGGGTDRKGTSVRECVDDRVDMTYEGYTDHRSTSVSQSIDDRVDMGEAAYFAQQFVKRVLISPSSAKFESFPARKGHVTKNGNTYVIQSYVDSQNSFGAMIRTNFTVIVSKNGDTWHLEDISVY